MPPLGTSRNNILESILDIVNSIRYTWIRFIIIIALVIPSSIYLIWPLSKSETKTSWPPHAQKALAFKEAETWCILGPQADFPGFQVNRSRLSSRDLIVGWFCWEVADSNAPDPGIHSSFPRPQPLSSQKN